MLGCVTWSQHIAAIVKVDAAVCIVMIGSVHRVAGATNILGIGYSKSLVKRVKRGTYVESCLDVVDVFSMCTPAGIAGGNGIHTPRAGCCITVGRCTTPHGPDTVVIMTTVAVSTGCLQSTINMFGLVVECQSVAVDM